MHHITIGICVKDLDDNIYEILDGIIKQNYLLDDIRIIIVYTNLISIDIINDYQTKNKLCIDVINDAGNGLAAARQLVIDNTSTEFLIWVDSDVVLCGDFIINQVEFMLKYEKIGIARGINEIIELSNNFISNVQNLFFSVIDSVYNGATICRLKALRDINGYDVRIKGAAEDVDLEMRMMIKGWYSAINNEALFTHKPKNDLKSLVKQYSWYGYGDHFLHHKYEGLIKIHSMNPIIFFGWGLKLSKKAYKKYHQKISYFIPFLCLLNSICWLAGFLKAHNDGYGHFIKQPEINIEDISKGKRYLLRLKSNNDISNLHISD